MSYLVVAPLIQARKVDGTFAHIYEGGLLPDDQDPVQLDQLIKSGMVATSQTSPDPTDEADRPVGNASLVEWQAYAVAHGMAEEEIAEMSRNDIRDLFTV